MTSIGFQTLRDASRLLLAAFAYVAWVQAAGADAAFKPAVTRSAAANRIAEKPDYVHAFSSSADWLEIGLESRTRYEMRANH